MPPLRFLENRKKCLDFGKKHPNCVHSWVISSIQNVVLRAPRRKSSAIFPCGAFFSCVFRRNVSLSALIPQNLSYPEKFLVARLFKYISLVIHVVVTLLKNSTFFLNRSGDICFFVKNYVYPRANSTAYYLAKYGKIHIFHIFYAN